MVFQFLKNLEIPVANRANQKLLNLSIHTLQQLLMYHLKDLVLHQVWQVVPVRITKWKGCHIHGPSLDIPEWHSSNWVVFHFVLEVL